MLYIVRHGVVRARYHQPIAVVLRLLEGPDQIIRILVLNQPPHKEEELSRLQAEALQYIGGLSVFGRKVNCSRHGNGITAVLFLEIPDLGLTAHNQMLVHLRSHLLHKTHDLLRPGSILAALPFEPVAFHQRRHAEKTGNPAPQRRRPGIVMNKVHILFLKQGAYGGLQPHPRLAEEIALRALHIDYPDPFHILDGIMVGFAIHHRLMPFPHQIGGEIVHIVLNPSQLVDITPSYECDFHEKSF